MNNKMALFCVLVVSFLGMTPSVFSANTLDVNFNGELIATACQVSTESLSKEIRLYNLRLKNINEGEPSAITPFSISIDKCSENDLQKSIKLTWKSSQLVDVDGNSFLPTQGASGVLLGIVDGDEQPVSWNNPISVGSVLVAENEQKINFGVFVRKPADGEVTAGEFSGVVTFNVEYE